MIVLQLVFVFAILATQAATLGLVFAWRCKIEPTVTGYIVPPKRLNCLASGLLWLAVVCIGGAAFLTCLIASSILMEAA
jgi:hypothetical protein